MDAIQEFPAVLGPSVPAAKPKMLPLRWPGALAGLKLSNPIPPNYRSKARKLRLRLSLSGIGKPNAGTQNRPDDITRLQTSFDPRESIRLLRTRTWTLWDLQYIVLAGYITFSLAILPSAPLIKMGAVVLGALLLLMPITRQFFLPSLPIWTYLLYFFASR